VGALRWTRLRRGIFAFTTNIRTQLAFEDTALVGFGFTFDAVSQVERLLFLRHLPHNLYIVHISNESLLVILVVGLVAGWLAGKIVRGAGFGLIGDLVIGIVGAFIGDWLLPRIGIHLGTGIISAIVNATIGAVLLLLVVGLLRGRFGGGWGGWGRRRWW
jgi:uncharacterized membrane protein YeaQ/YmgE (transglycosylase-associated protein family)